MSQIKRKSPSQINFSSCIDTFLSRKHSIENTVSIFQRLWLYLNSKHHKTRFQMTGSSSNRFKSLAICLVSSKESLSPSPLLSKLSLSPSDEDSLSLSLQVLTFPRWQSPQSRELLPWLKSRRFAVSVSPIPASLRLRAHRPLQLAWQKPNFI